MNKEKLRELFSKCRMDKYKNDDEHAYSLYLISLISHKIGMLEIIIRNRIDKTMSASNKNWIRALPSEISLDNDMAKDHDTFVSNQTFGFWLKIARHYKIEVCSFEASFLAQFSFKKYYAKNKDKVGSASLRYYQKSSFLLQSFLLQLIKIIRNRAFYFENLLKIHENGVPRLSVKVNFKKASAIVGISPNKITEFLDDILRSFDEKLINYVEKIGGEKDPLKLSAILAK